MKFCDYCKCKDCKNGRRYLSHAETVSGKWICDVCYLYEVCQKFPDGIGNPCKKDVKCSHRPELKTDWIKFKEKE